MFGFVRGVFRLCSGLFGLVLSDSAWGGVVFGGLAGGGGGWGDAYGGGFWGEIEGAGEVQLFAHFADGGEDLFAHQA